MLAPAGVRVEIDGVMGELPHFNPDEDGDTPPAVVRELRRRVGMADAIVISSPEYAHGVPGPLKNLLDWLVGSVEFPGKRVALIRSSSRGVHADAALREILRTMNAELVEEACVAVPVLGKDVDGAAIAADAEMRKVLSGAFSALVEPCGAKH